ncbi:hypothetical protein [Schlesneria paludicola]|uniref:hypothetical protein n=1 Tax=Schlesneria paludicola TaxID=360056 RepID=UPI00029A14FE|nr:hypothetical protein [Schlesneria paludicola]
MNAAQFRRSILRVRVLMPLIGLIGIGGFWGFRQLSRASYIAPAFENGGEIKVVVTDEQGNRIQDALIVPHGLRALQDPMTGYSWSEDEHGPRTIYATDQDGVVNLQYPKWVTLQSGTLTSGVILYASHPQYCSKWSIECPIANVDAIQPVHRVKLIQGGQIRAKGNRSNPNEPLGSVYAHLSNGDFATAWKDDGNSKISPVYAPGPHVARIIDQTDPDNLQFSDPIHVDLVAGQIVDVDVVVRPGMRFRGKLDTPPPVTNGFVVVTVVDLVSPTATRHDECACWRTWTTVNETGEFELHSLPPTSSITLHAWCDGYVSQNPDPTSIPHYAASTHRGSLPQFIDVKPSDAVHTIPMEACAQFEVTITDTNGRPLEGVEAHLNPNILVGVGGMTLFGYSTRAETRHPRQYASFKEQINDQMQAFRFIMSAQDENDLRPTYGGKTDANGKCRIDHLPSADNQALWISHPDWVVKDQATPPFHSSIRPELRSGELTKLSVQLVRKPALTPNMLKAPAPANAIKPPTVLQRTIENLKRLIGI